MVSVLAVVDSDSYLKWACSTLDALDDGTGGISARSVVIVRSPLAPTPPQVEAAVAGTAIAAPIRTGPGGLRRVVARHAPDVVLVGATGPVSEMIACACAGAGVRPRPVLISGLPGMALPATDLGVAYRRWSDAFIVHSRAEAAAYRDRFTDRGADPRIVLSRLPFLRDGEAAGKVRRVVFAPQSIVPAVRQQRLAVLAGLADVAAAGDEVVIKLRARAGERQTHNENHPYEVLWRAEHHRLGHPHAALRFVDGPMHTWLTPDAALVTVSSTAALESLALGLPTVLVSDFGIAEELLNEPFAGSGCLAPLVDVPDLLARGGPRPDPDWLEQNYLHTAPSELPRAVAELAAARRAGALPARDLRPISRVGHLRTQLRSLLPVGLSKRLARPAR